MAVSSSQVEVMNGGYVWMGGTSRNAAPVALDGTGGQQSIVWGPPQATVVDGRWSSSA